MKKYDFSGYATKVGLKCSDGRTIGKGAFKHNDGRRVPLVYQHLHESINNILGHAVLEDRDDGTYAYCKFNDSTEGKAGRERVQHGDIQQLSIYANGLKERGIKPNVVVEHGEIREVSLVLAGANPGAIIDNLVSFAHSEAGVVDTSEAIIHTGLEISLEDEFGHGEGAFDGQGRGSEGSEKAPSATDGKKVPASALQHAAAEGRTVKDVFDTLNEEQQNAVYALLAQAMDESGGSAQHSDNLEGEEGMKHNAFDAARPSMTGDATDAGGTRLSHAQIKTIISSARECGSWKTAFLAHANEFGFNPVEVLFPDHQMVGELETIKRDDDWVEPFLNAARKTPFARIRTMWADLTEDEARARGYITGKRKYEQVIQVGKRTTDPTTVYKKQKMNRDDVVDITEFDVIAFIWREMRELLREELARAVLIGDGREASSDDKIPEDKIRPIWKDDELYTSVITLAARTANQGTAQYNTETINTIDDIMRARKKYKGKGRPVYYTTTDEVVEMLLVRDSIGRKIYPTMADLIATLGVSEIVEVEVLEGANRQRVDDDGTTMITVDLVGILANMQNYTLGMNKGGEITRFEDFDIDFNQYKYLLETRLSGALIRPKSAVAIERRRSGASG